MKSVGCAHEAVNTNAYSLVLMIVTSFNANGFVGVSFALLLENNTTKMWTAASLYMYARMFREKYIGQAQKYARFCFVFVLYKPIQILQSAAGVGVALSVADVISSSQFNGTEVLL